MSVFFFMSWIWELSFWRVFVCFGFCLQLSFTTKFLYCHMAEMPSAAMELHYSRSFTHKKNGKRVRFVPCFGDLILNSDELLIQKDRVDRWSIRVRERESSLYDNGMCNYQILN